MYKHKKAFIKIKKYAILLGNLSHYIAQKIFYTCILLRIAEFTYHSSKIRSDVIRRQNSKL